MDLLEYQAKALFREMAIPVLPSQRIDYPTDLKGLKIPYPVVLKSQVRAGGRGRAGGIKFVENTIDAVAAAQTIFNLPIVDEYPEVLLAEAKYDADQELYLAVLLDPVARRPVLLGSKQGGINIEAAIDKMQQVIVDQDFSPFYARRLTLKMGLQGGLIQSVSEIVEKMYKLFVLKDLDLVEINPLGISRTGEVMALDGKVTANDEALGRHLDMAALAGKRQQASRVSGERGGGGARGVVGFSQSAVSALRRSELNPELSPRSPLPNFPLNLVELEGNIAILCNGAGLTMATLDAVTHAKGKPANFLNLGSFERYELTDGLRERLERGLELVSQEKSVKVILVNILGSVTACEEMTGAIAAYLERKRTTRTPQIVLRLVDTKLDTARERLAGLSVQLAEKLDEAVAQAVSLAK
ncbi:MAG TPA: succinate--CoA ligase subunit beta [Kamptonema sp.]|nr:succinate--CoA ligase subunit beta [Kamptonema sp.]